MGSNNFRPSICCGHDARVFHLEEVAVRRPTSNFEFCIVPPSLPPEFLARCCHHGAITVISILRQTCAVSHLPRLSLSAPTRGSESASRTHLVFRRRRDGECHDRRRKATAIEGRSRRSGREKESGNQKQALSPLVAHET